MYREEILEHWQNPQNFGVISDADLVIDQVNPLCGDEVTFYFKFGRGPVGKNALALGHSLNRDQRSEVGLHGVRVKQNSEITLSRATSPRIKQTATISGNIRMANGELRIAEVKFTGAGCAISIASASILSEVIKSKRVKELEKITGNDVLKLIGGSVAPARLKCAFLALEAVRKILNPKCF